MKSQDIQPEAHGFLAWDQTTVSSKIEKAQTNSVCGPDGKIIEKNAAEKQREEFKSYWLKQK